MIVSFAGGVGGARLAAGLAKALPAGQLTVIVNTADDFEHLGLQISPDLDTVMYTLAGLENPETGWGLRGETWAFMDQLATLGGETWFRLGDRDLATHIERTRRLADTVPLSIITADLAERLGITSQIVPMSDNLVATMLDTSEGELEFQDYFVRRQCEPEVRSITFEGADFAEPAAAAMVALGSPDLEAIVIGPSNPYVSIGPILAMPAYRDALKHRRVPVVAVSPLVAGKAVKGPAAKMQGELGGLPGVLGIAEHYASLIDGLVIDRLDEAFARDIEALGIAVVVTDTIMRDDESRVRVAECALQLARAVRKQLTPGFT